MERIKSIKDQLISQVQTQMNDLNCVDSKELGEVIDMIKDLSETLYYCEIYKQMEEAEEDKRSNNNYYYTERYYPIYDHYRDMDKQNGRMYYSSPSSNSGMASSSTQSNGSSDRSYYTERDYPIHIRDEREGRSPVMRKMYMESKDMHHDNSKSIKELESYMQELTSDMMELLSKASPEEKTMVQKKMNTLAAKVQNV